MANLSLYQELHLLLHSLPRRRYPYKGGEGDGFYLLYEKGEKTSFGMARIVRVGNYSGTGRLFSKREEGGFPSERSVFRRHIGCSLLQKEGKEAALFSFSSHTGNQAAAQKMALERRITHYLRENFSFVILPFLADEEVSKRLYTGLIALLAQAEERSCSQKWLGRWHPEEKIRSACLWNIKHTTAKPLSPPELLFLHEHLSKIKSK